MQQMKTALLMGCSLVSLALASTTIAGASPNFPAKTKTTPPATSRKTESQPPAKPTNSAAEIELRATKETLQKEWVNVYKKAQPCDKDYANIKKEVDASISKVRVYNKKVPIKDQILFSSLVTAMGNCVSRQGNDQETLTWYRHARILTEELLGVENFDNKKMLDNIDAKIEELKGKSNREITDRAETTDGAEMTDGAVKKSAFSFAAGFTFGGNVNSFSTPLTFSPQYPDQIFLSGPNGLDTYCTQGKPCELRGNYDLIQNQFNSLHGFGGIEVKFAHISDDREIFASGAFQGSSDMYGWIVGIGYATSAELLPQSWWKPSLRVGLAIVAGASTFSTTLKSVDTKPIEFNQYGNILSTTKDTIVEAPSGIQGGLRAEFDLMFRRKFSIGVHPSGLTAGSNRFSFWVPVVLRFHFEESLSKSNTSAKGGAQ